MHGRLPLSSCQRVDERVAYGLPHLPCLTARQVEDRLHHRQLRRRRIQPTECTPIIHHHPCSYHITPPIHRPCRHWHLQQCTQLLLLLYPRLRVHQRPLVRQ